MEEKEQTLEDTIIQMKVRVVNGIAKSNPNLAETLVLKEPLITSIGINKTTERETVDGTIPVKYREVYVLIDFTSKQEEHMDDSESYTLKLYEGFNQKAYFC